MILCVKIEENVFYHFTKSFSKFCATVIFKIVMTENIISIRYHASENKCRKTGMELT